MDELKEHYENTVRNSQKKSMKKTLKVKDREKGNQVRLHLEECTRNFLNKITKRLAPVTQRGLPYCGLYLHLSMLHIELNDPLIT